MIENNYLGDWNLIGLKEDFGQGTASLGIELMKNGATPEEMQKALSDYAKGVASQDPAIADAILNALLDLTPGIGDAKGFYEAEGMIDYLIASVGLIPGAGDVVGKALKEAKTLLKAGDVEGANKLIGEARSAINAPKLNSQLSAQEIANGHAFDKHVLQRGEFDTLDIKTREQFEQHVESVINNPTDVRYYSDGRVVYLDSTTRTVVIRNPGKGESTAFRPDYDIGWDKYIKTLPKSQTPPMN